MRTPRWLAEELDDAVKKVTRRQIDRREAVRDLSDAVYEKDEDLVTGLIAEWVSDELERRIRKQARLAVKEMEREADDVTGSARQLGFDDVCSYFFPPDTFPPSTTLAETGAYAYDLLARAERHFKVATDRVAFQERMLAAVNGDDKATLGEAVRALNEAGGAAAEG